MRRRGWALSAFVVAAAGLAAGCGGDDDGIPTGDVSKQEYIAQADEICGRGDREIERAAREAFGARGPAPSEEQVVAFAEETVIPNVQGQLDDLRELEAPEADADRIEEIYDTAQENLDALAEDPGVLNNPDANPFAEANRLARAYGLKKCGS
jgi:hypothetical protein